jgi:hypothetical protein
VRSILRDERRGGAPSDCGRLRPPIYMRCGWLRLTADIDGVRNTSCVGVFVVLPRRSISNVHLRFPEVGDSEVRVQETIVVDMSQPFVETRRSAPGVSHTRFSLGLWVRTIVRGSSQSDASEILPPVELQHVREANHEMQFDPPVILHRSGWSVELSRWFSNRRACERSWQVAGGSSS